MTQIRIKVRSIILALTGLVVAILVVRLGLDLFSANTSNSLVNFFYDISNPLVSQFDGVIAQSRDSSFRNLNIAAVVGIVVYSLLGILISEIVTAFLYESYENIIQNLVDIFFKFLEFLIFSRIVIDFFLIQDKAPFIQRINDLTNWTQDAFVAITFLDGRVNLSAILILIIVVIFDIVTESLIKSIFSTVGPEEHQLTKVYEPQQPTNVFVGNNQPNNPGQPLVQNINITMPNQPQGNYSAPQQPTQPPVNVFNPSNNYIHPTQTHSLGNPRPENNQQNFQRPTEYQLNHYDRSRAPLVQEASFRPQNNPQGYSNFQPRQQVNQQPQQKKSFGQKSKGFFNPQSPQ